MALVGRYERMNAERAYELGMISQIVDPPEQPPRGGAGAGARPSPRTRRPRCAPPRRRCGVRSSTGSPTAAAPAPSSSSRMWGHPDQTEGPPAFAEKRPVGPSSSPSPGSNGGRRRRETRPRRGRSIERASVTAGAGSAAVPTRRPAPPWVVLLLTSCAGVLTGLGLAVMSVAFPSIVEAFPEASPAKLSWVTNVFPIVGAATLVPAGVLADRYGRKRMLLIGVAVFTLGSCLSAVAGTPGFLIFGRGVQSLGASAYTPAATALLISAFPPHRLPMAIGVWAVAGGISSAAAPAVGGLAIDAGGWRWAFWMNVPVALLVLAAGPRVFQESITDRTRKFPDPFGAVLITAGLSLVVLGVVQSGAWGWLGGRTLAAFGGGLLALVWLAWRCTHHPEPILRLSLLRQASAGPANLGMLVFATAWFCLFFALVFWFTTAWGWTALRAGLAAGPVSLVSGGIAVVVAPIASRLGHRRFLLVGSLGYAASVVWLWRIIGAEPDWSQLIPAEILLGLSSGLVLPSFIALGVVGMPVHLHAVASSVSFTTQRVGTSLGTALAITFLADTSLEGTAWLHRAMVVALVGSIAAFVISLRVRPPPEPVGLRFARRRRARRAGRRRGRRWRWGSCRRGGWR